MILKGDWMKSVGIICEYNPFHYGHLYHIEKVKELFPDAVIVLVLSGNVTQRGELSVLTKWEKTALALSYGVDLVVELPFVFASQAADIFAKGAISILKDLEVEALVFGSEMGEIEPFLKSAETSQQESYQQKLKTYLEQGWNYPTSLSKALEEECHISISQPNDLLGYSYVKEILAQHAKIKPVTIRRTNSYHHQKLEGKNSSATSIRESLKKKEDISSAVLKEEVELLKEPIFLSDFYPLIRYKIITEEHLEKYQTVDERIAHRLKKMALSSSTLEEFLTKVKTKYYTYNRLMRMCSHLLFSFTKEENQYYQEKRYLRILGFSKKGKQYLHEKKKKTTILSNYASDKENLLTLELRVAKILSLKKGEAFLKEEISHKPIQKEEN